MAKKKLAGWIDSLMRGNDPQDFCNEYQEPEPSRRQDFAPDAFIRSGSIYLTKTEQILKKKLIRGSYVKPIEVSEFHSINIDEEIDFYKVIVTLPIIYYFFS